MNWNVYSRILDEKLGDAEYELGQAEKAFKAAKAKVEALRMEKNAFEDAMQVKMEDLGVEVEFAPITKPSSGVQVLIEKAAGDNVGSMLGSKLTKEDHEAVQLSIFFSGNV